MTKKRFEFRPARIGKHVTVIGQLFYRNFEPIHGRLHAPVYANDEKIELNRFDYTRFSAKDILKLSAWARNTLEMLKNDGNQFKVEERLRYKSNNPKDHFGQHSNNSVVELYYSKEGGITQNFNDDLISFTKRLKK